MKTISSFFAIFLTASIFGLIVSTSIGFMVKAEVTQGVISIAFDDNYQNQFDYAFPLMQNYGIVGTFYAVSDHVGLSGYMSYAELQTLQSSGNEIGSHSKTHTTLTSLSEEQIRQECSVSKQALEDHGLTVKNFAFPNGPTNDAVDSIVSQYYRSGRTAYIEPYLMDIPTTQFRVPGFSAELPLIQPGTALFVLEDMIDQVYSTNGWAIIFFHNIVPNGGSQDYTTSTTDFESFLQYIINKGVRTLTVNEALDLTSLSITSNYGTVTPTSGTYSIGDTINIQAFAPSVGGGERYVWLGWNGSGAGSYSGSDNPASVTLGGPVNETALWRHEFKLSVVSEAGSTSPSAGDYWYEAGANVSVEAFAPSVGGGERYVWLGWNGSGAGSYTGFDNPASITFDGPINQTSLWRHEFELSIQADYGTTSPSSGKYWCEAGATVNIEALAPPNNGEERYLFKSWKGTGQGSYSGSSELASVVMNSAITQLASWAHQYQISIVCSGIGSDTSETVVTVDGSPFANGATLWLQSGSSHNYEFQAAVEVSSGQRYAWENSSGLSTQKSGSFYVSGSDALSANYKIQFLLDVISPYGVVKGTGWYDSGSTAYVTMDQSIANVSQGIRYLFIGWSDDASGNSLTSEPLFVDCPKTATALWKKQFLVVFDQNGLPNDYNASIAVDSVNHNLPFSVWADDGENLHFGYPDHIPYGFGVYYVLEYPVNQSTLDVDSSISIVAQYALEYDSAQFILIFVPVVLVSLVVFVFLWKKGR
jgi:peptidoglycan/xylan/chitin deacetylase (PgdA/CDA1 family)